jgi:flagellar M-ring protein FliF
MDFKESLNKVKEKVSKLDSKKKLIIGGVAVAIFASFIFLFSFSSKGDWHPLYPSTVRMKQAELERIKERLRTMEIEFKQSGNVLYVANKEKAAQLRTRLGVDGLTPERVRGFELFDIQSFGTTDFQRKISLQRAMKGQMIRHLKSIEEIEDASVIINVPEQRMFQQDQNPVTVSVTITPSPSSDITTNRKKIKGLRELIVRGVPGLKKDNVTILTNTGQDLTELLSPNAAQDRVELAKKQSKIRESLRVQYINDLTKQLERVFTKDRFELKVNLELKWDEEFIERNSIIGTVIKQDNPDTPYDDSQVVQSVAMSRQTVRETFRGPAFIPEGPAGVEENVPPALRERMDRFSHYERNQTTENNEVSRERRRIQNDPYDILKVTASVFLDGRWEKLRDNTGDLVLKNGKISRKFLPVSDDEIRRVQEVIQTYLGAERRRRDAVSVKAMRFDRTSQFEREDDTERARRSRRQVLIASIIAVIALIILYLFWRVVKKELERRRRLREEELARQQQAMREAALRAAEEESAQLELSPEDKARKELMEHATQLAKEKPEEVAQLLRTWMAEE